MVESMLLVALAGLIVDKLEFQLLPCCRHSKLEVSKGDDLMPDAVTTHKTINKE